MVELLKIHHYYPICHSYSPIAFSWCRMSSLAIGFGDVNGVQPRLNMLAPWNFDNFEIQLETENVGLSEHR